MNVLLVDPDRMARTEVERSLRREGLDVRAFADGSLGFLYLLARMGEIDAVVVNTDSGAGLVRRLEALEPLAVVTYSGSDLGRGGEIAMGLLPRRETH